MVFNERISSHDMFFTPDWIVELLCDYVRFPGIIWEPACGAYHMVKALNKIGYGCVPTDIAQGEDFLDKDSYEKLLTYPRSAIHEPPSSICTNPPFSLKNEFLERCIEIGLPFALLMPLPALEGRIRGSLLSKIKDLSLIIPDRRVAFIGADKSPNFSSAWFCSGFNLDRQLIFVDSSPYLPVKKRKKDANS